MENKTDEIYKKLKAPFPKAAYTKDTSRGFELTSIKAQYIIDRLNTALGLFGWSYSTETISNNEKGVLFKGSLTIKIGDLEKTVFNYGSSINKKVVADTYKSASTDALGKCASMIGVGDAAFKGEVKVDEIEDIIEEKDLPLYIRKAGQGKGTLLKDMTDKDVNSMIAWCETQEKLGGPLLEDYKAIKQYIKTKG